MSNDFFPPPPAPRKPEPRPPSPPWSGPPYGVLPGAVALEVILGQSESAAVHIGRCAAYPTGLDFELHVIASVDAGDELDPSLNGIYHRPGRASTYEGMLRFGVAFADGRRASNLGSHAPTDEQPDGPVLWGMGGGGGGGRWQQGFWMWPLPPAGPMTFVCEWPAAGIAQTRVEVDSELLRDAAGRARALFPRSGLRGSGGHLVTTPDSPRSEETKRLNTTLRDRPPGQAPEASGGCSPCPPCLGSRGPRGRSLGGRLRPA